MRGLQPAGATRVTLDVIIPSPRGLTPEKWKQTATLCPLDWPSNYSLLRLWHVPKDLHQFVDQLNQQMNHRHMFSRWEINYDKFTSRVLYQLPAHYLPAATLRQHVQTRDFPADESAKGRLRLMYLSSKISVLSSEGSPPLKKQRTQSRLHLK